MELSLKIILGLLISCFLMAVVLIKFWKTNNVNQLPEMKQFKKAAIACHGQYCSKIGRKMLLNGGNAVDAAIATMLCEGIVMPQSTGLGGGFIMTIFNKTQNKAFTLVAKETAPSAAYQNMFANNSDSSLIGTLSIAIPGELKGYQAVHERFGKLPWRALFQPAIKLSQKGFKVDKSLATCFLANGRRLKKSQTFRDAILKQFNGEIPQLGQTCKWPVLAKTLDIIANSPKKADALYNGTLTTDFVKDIQDGGGIISVKDMTAYQVRWEEPFNATLSGGLTVYSAALPGSGVLITFLLRLLDGPLQQIKDEPQRVKLIVEAYKHAFGRRTGLADPHFVNKDHLELTLKQLIDNEAIEEVRSKLQLMRTNHDPGFYGAEYLREDHGTDSTVVVDVEGNAVSITSSLHYYFGSAFVSKSTGIILNSHMNDFSTPGSRNICYLEPTEMNKIVAGKRPMSSMSPTVVVDKNGDIRLVISGAGGPRIITQVTKVAIEVLWNRLDIKKAIDKPRFHHQLTPMCVHYEEGMDETHVRYLNDFGHSTYAEKAIGFVVGIEKRDKYLYAYSDYRKPAEVSGI